MKKYSYLRLILLLNALACFSFSANTQQPAAVQDIGWPRQVSKDGALLIYYQPQVDEWTDYKKLKGRMAFSLTPQGGSASLGVASIECGTIVDKESRTVYFRDVIMSTRFPSLRPDLVPLMDDLFRKLVPMNGNPIAVDRIIADLQETRIEVKGVPVKNDPPQIFYSSGPAILLMVDGEPALAPIEKTKLEFVVNTNWDLFYDKPNKTYYLLANNIWLSAEQLEGPWTHTQKLPKDMSKLPAGQNFDEVKKFIPAPALRDSTPKIYYSNQPAELILLQGAPIYTKIDGTQLLYIANSDNDIFIDKADDTYYILLSGRWFRSKAFGGPWSFAGNDLPQDFSRIPENSDMGYVLASVPGTVQASDAVMLAQIPTTAVVNKKEAEAKVKVNYDGDPQFKPIESTSLQYATNTQDKIIQVGDLYYLCFQGVWFMSTKADGPWKTADSIPNEIYTIPPSSPVYNVTYVTQTNATEETVESSSTSGYLGMFVIGMTFGCCIGYGSGYYYPPYMYYPPGMMYPIYRPYPCSYGVGAVYNPYTGGYAAGRVAYGPYGAARTSAWYNPSTGRYGRSASAQGWYGGRSVASAYNPYTGGYGATRQSHNAYGQWGSSVATRGGEWAKTGHISSSRGTAAAYRTSTGQQGGYISGQQGTVVRGRNGTYAGNDGNVYRKNDDGSWSKYNNGNWESPSRGDGATPKQLDNSAKAQDRGQTKTSNYQSQQRTTNTSRGNFGGSGMRGGGGRRR